MPTTEAVTERKTTLTLKCLLTEKERLNFGDEMSREFQSRTAAEAEMKEVAQGYKARIAAHETQIAKIAYVIGNGYEMRPVACTAKYDYSAGEVHTFRNDTGELADTRKMYDHELQTHLDMEDEAQEDGSRFGNLDLGDGTVIVGTERGYEVDADTIKRLTGGYCGDKIDTNNPKSKARLVTVAGRNYVVIAMLHQGEGDVEASAYEAITPEEFVSRSFPESVNVTDYPFHGAFVAALKETWRLAGPEVVFTLAPEKAQDETASDADAPTEPSAETPEGEAA